MLASLIVALILLGVTFGAGFLIGGACAVDEIERREKIQ